MEWFEIPVPKESRDSRLTVAVDSVIVWVRGPWKMEVPVTPGFK
ncbi:hypothetical protein [Acididesulfobacillus acetoxydans]|nr:hypothetical protein [Acididesulfobacillus acetoxydans]